MPTKQNRLDKIEEQIAKLKAREAAIKSAERKAERKVETRRKVILGGLLIDAAGKDARFATVVDQLMKRIDRDADKRAFDGWERPDPSSGGEPPAIKKEPSPKATTAPSLPLGGSSSGGAAPSPRAGGGTAG